MKSIGLMILILMSALSLEASPRMHDALIPLSLSYALEEGTRPRGDHTLPSDLIWQENPGQRLTLGYETRTVWIRIQGQAEWNSLEQHILDMGNSQADHVEMFLQSGERVTLLATTGDERPFPVRAYPHRSLMFKLGPVQPHEAFLLRIQSTGPHNYWLRVMPEPAVWHEAGIEDFLYGTSIGIIFIMACYNFFIFLLQRDRSHLFYTLYAASYIFLILGYKGYGFQYLWSMAPGFQKHATGIGIHTTAFSLLLFVRFLFIRDVDRNLRRWLDATCAIALMSLLVLVLTMQHSFWKKYGISGLALFAFGVYVLAVVHVWKHPNRSLWATLGAIFCLHLGGIITLLTAQGILPYHWATINGMILGGNIEMTLLTFALADRFHFALRESARVDLALRGAVDDELAEKLKHNPQLLREEASERDLTVLFLDIVNSSRTSQLFPSRDLYHKLRTTLNDITRIIRAHGGVVNRSLGDGVLCYFGLSWDGQIQADHPTQALKAAVALQRHFLTECLDPEQQILFPVRIGLHSGRMYLGSIGDQQRVDFTLFGYEVNIAKRLEDAAHPFRILMSQSSFEKLNRLLIEDSIHPIRVPIKNQSELLQAYECNPFAQDMERMQSVQLRLWAYFGTKLREPRMMVHENAMRMEILGQQFRVRDISGHGLCVEGPMYLARGVQITLKVFGDVKLERELESCFLFPLYATVRWSVAGADFYRHGLELQHLHPEQRAIWLELFRPYVQVSDVG